MTNTEWEYRVYIVNVLGSHVPCEWTDRETAEIIHSQGRTDDRENFLERRRKAGPVQRLNEGVLNG